MDLAFDQKRVDHRADVVEHPVTDDIRLTGARIDLDLGDMAAIGECRRPAVIGAGLIQAGFDFGRQHCRLQCRLRDIDQRDGPVGAGNGKRAAFE